MPCFDRIFTLVAKTGPPAATDASNLPRRTLGATGIETAVLSLGTVKLGRNTGVKYPQAYTIPNDAQARSLLTVARDLGINLLDTAPAYGTSEHRLGELLAGERQDWILCTKVGESFDGKTSSYDFSPEACRKSIERSLQRLQTDHLDIVLIHSDGRDEEILLKTGTLQALQVLKEEGKVRFVGMSHKSVRGAEIALSQGADVLMATLNPNELGDAPIITQAAEAGCGVLIKKAMASGHGSSADLKFAAAHQGVHSIVVGTTSPEHLAENAGQLSA